MPIFYWTLLMPPFLRLNAVKAAIFSIKFRYNFQFPGKRR